MFPTRTLTCALLLALMAGCSQQTQEPGKHDSVLQHITIQADRVGANAPDGKTAWIDAAGALTIDGKPVELNAEQRALTARYHATATGIRSDGVAVGKAGAAVAGKAVSSVIQGLSSGKPDDIGPKIEAEARNVEAKAMLLCRRVGELQATQDALAASLPAFAPYATLTGSETSDCRKQTASKSKPTQLDHDLMAAAEAGDVAAVQQLVEKGANVDTRIRGDGTALIIAARHGQLPMVEQLLQLGADVDKPSRGDGNPLIAAAVSGHDDVIQRLLAAGAEVDAVVAGDETPLINAARQGHLDIVKRLVAHGADVNLGVTADMGEFRSPLNQAKNDDVRKYLLSQGAQPQGGS